MSKNLKRIGLFGGSFDPPHLGHLILAEQCRVQANLDQILFIPTYQAPHKKNAGNSTHHCESHHRVKMLQLVVKENPNFELHLCEIRRQGTSYTFETITELLKEYPREDFRLFFLIGADSLADLHHWYKIEEILEQIDFVTVNREPYREELLQKSVASFSQKYQQQLLKNRIVIPTIGISSTQLRTHIGQKKSIRYLIPEMVEHYIKEHQLYQ